MIRDKLKRESGEFLKSRFFLQGFLVEVQLDWSVNACFATRRRNRNSMLPLLLEVLSFLGFFISISLIIVIKGREDEKQTKIEDFSEHSADGSHDRRSLLCGGYSLSDIMAQLLKTSAVVAVMVVILGVIYQFVEGQSIQEIVRSFEPKFTMTDGFFASCYVAFYRIVSFGTGTLVSEVLFYRKKGLAVSQGMGVTALHMIMYKLAVVFGQC